MPSNGTLNEVELHKCMMLFGPLPVLTSEDTEQFQEIFNRVNRVFGAARHDRFDVHPGLRL